MRRPWLRQIRLLTAGHGKRLLKAGFSLWQQLSVKWMALHFADSGRCNSAALRWLGTYARTTPSPLLPRRPLWLGHSFVWAFWPERRRTAIGRAALLTSTDSHFEKHIIPCASHLNWATREPA
jgi:hypothetical protein